MEPIQRVTAPTLDVLETLLAADAPLWGLVIIKQTGRPSGTIYPILERLERQGWIDGSWDESERSGPRRRLYEFTPDGRIAAEALAATAAERRATAAARRARAGAGRPVTS